LAEIDVGGKQMPAFRRSRPKKTPATSAGRTYNLKASLLLRFLRDDEGATMVEYGIMVALIAAVCILVITTLGTQVQAAFQTIVNAL